MATPIRIKRSSVPGKKPTIEQLQVGELAVNFYDGKLFFKQDTNGVGIGTRIVEVGAGQSTGKTIYVTANGDDNNTGVNDLDAKGTINGAIELSIPGDTIKVLPGTYIENNPINIPDNVSIEGAELRRCLVQPQNSGEDLFYVGNGAHITDLSFIGNPSTNGAAVISYRPLAGVSSDRFFDAARLIRQNLGFISNETVEYMASLPSNQLPVNQTIDNAWKIDAKDRIENIYRAICHDIVRGGNSKCIGLGQTYTNLNLNHTKAFEYSIGVARAVINNSLWADKPEGSQIAVNTADYDGSVGILTITTSTDHGLELDDVTEVKNITFQCDLGQTVYPKGSIGYNFPVHKKISNNQFEVVVGFNGRAHSYVSGGTVRKQVNYQNVETQLRDLSIQSDVDSGFNNVLPSCSNVHSAVTVCVGIITGIMQNTFDLNPPLTGFTITYPGGNGVVYDGTDPNVGILTASLSPTQGVGIIRKGPYIRNCTNFIPNSIGARIDGFHSDEGDQINPIGVQGSFNVDSYTQFNQGGIGVSVTNGAYAQLVSLFTICDDTAVYTGGGGQCDLTNSNSSFGRRGLVSEGSGDQTSKCSDHYSGKINNTAAVSQNIVTISGVGNNRPYNGQTVYFDKKYNVVSDILVTNGGSGYNPNNPPLVTVDPPTGPGVAIPAQATAEVVGDKVTRIFVRGGGSQYETPPGIQITGGGVGAAATSKLEAIYYTIDEATVPSAGVSTVTLIQNLNNEVTIGTTAYFARQSLQIVSSHSFQYIGAGNNIENVYPSRGGVSIPENEVIKLDGGEVNYTSTDQRGNFRIGDGVVIDQATGTVSGNIYIKSLFTQVTPFILALGGD